LIAEVEAVRRAGARIVFLVDDNFIGNKVAAKNMLPALIAWQRENGYPILFSTEASVNLADEPELTELMVQANFRQVFIGLKSPRAESLKETKKFQNTRGDSMLTKIARVRDAGLVPNVGFIVGFDNDDAAIFEEQFRFIQDSLALGRNAMPLHHHLALCLMHWHFYNMARHERKASMGNPSIEARIPVAASS